MLAITSEHNHSIRFPDWRGTWTNTTNTANGNRSHSITFDSI